MGVKNSLSCVGLNLDLIQVNHLQEIYDYRLNLADHFLTIRKEKAHTQETFVEDKRHKTRTLKTARYSNLTILRKCIQKVYFKQSFRENFMNDQGEFRHTFS